MEQHLKEGGVSEEDRPRHRNPSLGGSITLLSALAAKPNVTNHQLENFCVKAGSCTLIWLPPGRAPPKEPKRAGYEWLPCCIWDSQRMLYYELKSSGTALSAELYGVQLQQVPTQYA
ncbi:hypothetical protein ANCCAN_13720 [Ancylostoma caninum]|uniref:Uncharacterized protein n=1 Tax=Ancylostoma caninum TaxID=29170 RepID=A0A368G7B5_ANCCA|nr:hypothetical protein ANCCAN_13720 [Ancylostoma caninum]